MGWWDRVKQAVEVGLNGRAPEPLEPIRPIPATTKVAHDLELARTLPREVYADWLTERGDIRGELCGIEDDEFATQFIEAHVEHFYGPLAACGRFYGGRGRWPDRTQALREALQRSASPHPLLEVEWRKGFLHRLRVNVDAPTSPRLLAAALAHPSLALLGTLLVESFQRNWALDELPDLPSDLQIGEVQTRDSVLRAWLGAHVIRRPWET